MLDPTAYAKCLLCALLEQACVDYKSFARRAGSLSGTGSTYRSWPNCGASIRTVGIRVYGRPAGTRWRLRSCLISSGRLLRKLCIDYTAGLSPNKVRRALGFDTRPPNQIAPDAPAPCRRRGSPAQAAQVEDAHECRQKVRSLR
jgi:hypothetical protein